MALTADQVFLRFSRQKLSQFLARIETCIARLDDSHLWLRTGENANAAGNLCLHLEGNVRQWILHGVGGAPDQRRRNAEFAARGGRGRDELLAALRATVEEALQVIGNQTDLLRVIRPQTYEVTVLEAIYHVVEHFAQHTAQIIYATKAFTGEDLGFYSHLDNPHRAADPTP